MGVEQRRRDIARWVEEAGRVDVGVVARRLGVAPETVRRDLRCLESAGRLQRVHGGAVRVQERPPALTPVPQRPPGTDGDGEETWAGELWSRLAGAGTVVLGGGAPMVALARAVLADPPSTSGPTLVTSSLDVTLLLAPCRRLTVLHLGGVVRPAGAGAGHPQEGEWALSELRRIRADVSVVAPAGIDPVRGLSEHSTGAAAMCRAQVQAGRRVVALLDKVSAGTDALVRVGGLDLVDELVLAAAPTAGATHALARLVRARDGQKSPLS